MPCDATDAGNGRYTFVPQGVAVDLQAPGTANSSCTIEFTFDVARTPTTTAQPPPALGGYVP